LLADAVFAAQMFLAGSLGVALRADDARLRLCRGGAYAVFADQVWIAAVGGVAEVAWTAEGAERLRRRKRVLRHVCEV
jgi:hypothetical protein